MAGQHSCSEMTSFTLVFWSISFHLLYLHIFTSICNFHTGFPSIILNIVINETDSTNIPIVNERKSLVSEKVFRMKKSSKF